jgi:GTPase SAR1 family protein
MNINNRSYEISPLEVGLNILGKLQAEINPVSIKQSVVHKTRDVLRNLQVQTPTLAEVLDELGDLPPFTVVIGLAEDGLPILLNLEEPETGALLVVGDPLCGKTSLLNMFIRSACTTNPPRSLRFCCISTRPEEFYSHKTLPHCYKIVSAYSEDALKTIEELVGIAEQRKYGRYGDEAIILVIDDLPGTIEQIGVDGMNLLRWLVEHGAYSKIWTTASLDTSQTGRLEDGFTNSFPTWILGKIDAGKVGSNLARDKVRPAARLIPGAQFCTYSEEWIRFWNMRI